MIGAFRSDRRDDGELIVGWKQCKRRVVARRPSFGQHQMKTGGPGFRLQLLKRLLLFASGDRERERVLDWNAVVWNWFPRLASTALLLKRRLQSLVRRTPRVGRERINAFGLRTLRRFRFVGFATEQRRDFF